MRHARRLGYTQDDIDLARIQMAGERRAGVHPLRSLAEVLAGKPARPRPSAHPADLTPHQVRRRGGRCGVAALLLDQEAANEDDADRASLMREMAVQAKGLSRKPAQLEFDFWRGGVVTADQYHDAIRSRLMAANATPAERLMALATLQEIKRWLGWQSFTCTKTAADLCDLLGVLPPNMADTLALLEKIGAITRTKKGRTKVIHVTPEGAFRGNVDRHNEVMDSYRAAMA
jgi:hypothetical protein